MSSVSRYRLTIFIVLVVLVTIAFIIWFSYKPLKAYLSKKKTCQVYYKEVNKVALYYDFYLVNNFEYSRTGEKPVHFDHILAGDKYIYLITDKYYTGDLCGRGDDHNWSYYYKGKEKQIIKNPLYENKKELKQFSMETGISRDMLVGVVLINDECFVTPFDTIQGDSIMINLSGLEGLIKNYENSSVSNIDVDALEEVIKTLHNENINNKDDNEQ